MTDITIQRAVDQYRSGDTLEALRQFRLLATPDNPQACYAFGYFLIEILGDPSFYQEGWMLIKIASAAGNNDAKEFLAFQKLHGISIEKDIKSAIDIYTNLANEGVNSAIVNIGGIYSSEDYEVQNFQTAAHWYKIGADLGDGECQYQLAILQISQNSLHDINGAIQNLIKSTESGNCNAAYELGMIHYTGNGVDEDSKKAVEYFQIAYDLGSMDAAAELGFIYLTGDQVQKNEMKGFELVLQAAESGNAFAQDQLGRCFHYGKGCEESAELAELWYRKAAEQGNSGAMRNLGNLKCNWRSSIIDPSYIQYTIKAAKLGDTIALSDLGWHYFEGKIVPQSNTKAFALFMLSEYLAESIPSIQNDSKSSKEMVAMEISVKERKSITSIVNKAINLQKENLDWLSTILNN